MTIDNKHITMLTPNFAPGFKISFTDMVTLILGAIGAYWVAHFDSHFSLVILFTVGHFFLFCNVFRIDRHLEILWAVIFIILIGCTIRIGFPGWTFAFGGSLGVTFIFIGIQLRKPSYHGIAWNRINPDLYLWWSSSNLLNPKE